MATCEIEQELKIKFLNADNEIREVKAWINLEVGCYRWNEYCHGVHTITEPIDESVEAAINEWFENYTFEDIQELVTDDIVKEIIEVDIWS